MSDAELSRAVLAHCRKPWAAFDPDSPVDRPINQLIRIQAREHGLAEADDPDWNVLRAKLIPYLEKEAHG